MISSLPSTKRSQFAALALAGATFLSGCSAMPDSGPTESNVLHSEKHNQFNYRILPIDTKIVSILSQEHPPLISDIDTSGNIPATNDRIGAGDTLAITIFELGSGLFSSASGALSGGAAGASGGATSAPGPSTGVTNVNLPNTQVEEDGTILVPYVGRLRAAGLTPQILATAIQEHLHGKSQNPQVMVRIATDIGNTVIVSGEVKRPGRELLTTAQERLSDLIAIGGGATYPPEDTHVELLRANRSGGTDLATLQSHPEQDIRAKPGDRIHVIYQPRTYTLFGAGQHVTETPFKSPDLTLAEALARAGGPADQRADPNAVFLFRFEDVPAARTMGLTTPQLGTGVPVVYKLDMMDPNSYFLAQRIPMKNKDVLFIANAKVNRFYKFNQLVSTIIQPFMTAAWFAK
ncbi:polysaccharide biosynthesis/export family protein [Kozakia baliensis]|uniref:polysaccharide biosynthesis/export family protein n=1 Tax=Kozakia baliensis TaxID=153496 RepID=UPI0009DD063B|nr:polysaccharide biosynthesis/export family protein [Kozakia baliensis]